MVVLTGRDFVTFRAYANEKPVIIGGVKLDLDWRPFEGGIEFQLEIQPSVIRRNDVKSA